MDKEKLIPEQEYEIHRTPNHASSGPRMPGMPPVGLTEKSSSLKPDVSQGNKTIISIHGYLHKQGKRVIKGPIHKSWKKRYFGK